MVVSFKASAARLSHEDANAGTADKHARTNITHFIIGIFIWASSFGGVYTTVANWEPGGRTTMNARRTRRDFLNLTGAGMAVLIGGHCQAGHCRGRQPLSKVRTPILLCSMPGFTRSIPARRR